MDLADRPGSWPVVSSRDLHRTGWVMALREDVVRRPGHDDVHPRWVLEHPGAAVVLAVDDDDRVCCLRQYRHPGGGWFVELPAGLLDVEGEDPLETARRELREEAGLEAQRWTPLLTLRPSVGISAEVQHLFVAEGLRAVGRGDFEPTGEEAEMEVFWAPRTELVAAALDGRLTTSSLVSALLADDAARRARG